MDMVITAIGNYSNYNFSIFIVSYEYLTGWLDDLIWWHVIFTWWPDKVKWWADMVTWFSNKVYDDLKWQHNYLTHWHDDLTWFCVDLTWCKMTWHGTIMIWRVDMVTCSNDDLTWCPDISTASSRTVFCTMLTAPCTLIEWMRTYLSELLQQG